MSLPSAWVDRIFEKLVLVYGQPFLRRWEHMDLAAVKADWAHELAGFVNSPEALRHALEHLPTDGPPTVLQFRQLSQRAPQMAPPALPMPKPDPQRLATELAKMQGHRQQATQPRGPKAWAWALREREERGEHLTPLQRQAWREVLADRQPFHDDEEKEVAA